MKFVHIITSSFYLILAVLFFIGFLLGALNIHFSDRTNYCEMTFMYEYPQFVKISMDNTKEFPQYGLYAYSEGRFTERARKMWFDGVPVLFLPGNSGSHMQARSLASVALRKALSRGYEFHFDYFTISFNEELSGLYGGVLQRQTRYAAACITKILSLYKTNKYTKNVPTSVVLIGHSMGGLIAKRLLAYPSTMNSTNITIALASPLAAPVINFDSEMDDFYTLMEKEWTELNGDPMLKETKTLISFGSGARDILMPARLTASRDSDVNALTTSIPGVWVSSDHVSIVWCKQLVMAINRYLFALVDPVTEQVTPYKDVHMKLAQQYFVANRSMTLNPDVTQPTVPMLADAFWYEDNRRIYQISRPEIDKMTYLMIRLASFPQNRFVAIESVNHDDKDWIFGCNAQYTYNTYRYCKQGTSLTELSRWTGAAADFGKRKLATVQLHSLVEKHPDWTHVVIKVSPTRKPVTLNVDVNDLASRQITVDLPSDFSFSRTIIKQETEVNSLYYELSLPGFNAIWQAYLLYVEPTAGCKTEYHVSAEVHVPWGENQEYYHYFTHLKRSPMKLRIYKTNPNVTRGYDTTDNVKVLLLLDPKCKYTISISSSWYHILAQSVRTYTPVLVPYIAGAALMIAKTSILSLSSPGGCITIHGALRSMQPYASMLFIRVFITLLLLIPFTESLFENANWHNHEIQYFIRSIMVLPAYMVAVGLLNVAAAALLIGMVFSSQLAHRMLFRIIWKGGPGLVERVAMGLQKIPMVVSAALVTAGPLSCGAASLVAGAAFYAFMISKMYEEYLEDYFYKLLAKCASRFCYYFKGKKDKDKNEPDTSIVPRTDDSGDGDAPVCLRHPHVRRQDIPPTETLPLVPAIEEETDTDDDKGNDENIDRKENKDQLAIQDVDKKENEPEKENDETKGRDIDDIIPEREIVPVPKPIIRRVQTPTQSPALQNQAGNAQNESNQSVKDLLNPEEISQLLFSDINFHTMMLILWLVVTLVNLPALLTWARSFKYGMVLQPDTSRVPGLIMSISSMGLWQMDGPRKHLKCNGYVATFITALAVIVFTLGPLSVNYINWCVPIVFFVITAQQICDTEDIIQIERPTSTHHDHDDGTDSGEQSHNDDDDDNDNDGETGSGDDDESLSETERPNDECDRCNENVIYNVFKNLREKFSFNED